jgi:hypothetical protein
MDDRIEEPIRSINPEELQRSLAGYCREKKCDKAHLHIQFARDSLPRQSLGEGGCHPHFISKPKHRHQPIITDQAPSFHFIHRR